jgi:hypothetical protein
MPTPEKCAWCFERYNVQWVAAALPGAPDVLTAWLHPECEAPWLEHKQRLLRRSLRRQKARRVRPGPVLMLMLRRGTFQNV